MYQDTIEKLLEKHFGKPTDTLTRGAAARHTAGTYYISLPDPERIDSMIEGLARTFGDADGQTQMPDLQWEFDHRRFEGDNWCQCARLITRSDGWAVRFYRVTGVTFHMSYRRSVVATLALSKNCEFTLNSRDTEGCFGIWGQTEARKPKPGQSPKTAGVSYWCNKLLRSNNLFRRFVADLLTEIGERERKYILKDAARAIEHWGFFLPEITYQEILRFRTPEELARSMLPEGIDPPVRFNRVDLNRAFVICRAAPFVDRQDWQILTDVPEDVLSDTADLRTMFEGFDVPRFVGRFYCFWHGYDDGETFIEDYARASMDAHRPIRLNFEEQAIQAAHDRMTRIANRQHEEEEMKKPLVTLPSRFERLAEQLAERGEFEWITDSARLYLEGEAMTNCVFTRRNRVRQDKSAIFHWKTADRYRNYTVQFSVDWRGMYVLDEVAGMKNRAITDDDFEELRGCLTDVADMYGNVTSYRSFWQPVAAEDDYSDAIHLTDIPF